MSTCIFPNSPITPTLFRNHAINNIMSTNDKNATVASIKRNRNFQVFIKTLTGQSITIDIAAKDKVVDLKFKIWKKIEIPVETQRLIFQMSQLEDERTIESYNIQKESTIHLALRLVAGVQVKVATNQGRVYALGNGNTLADATNTYNHQPFYDSNQQQQQSMYNLQDSKKRGTYTKKACANCRKSHSACDAGRPCKRCLQLGLTDCMDAERKSKKRDFGEMTSQPFTNMMDFLPLLGQLPEKVEQQEEIETKIVKKEISFEEEKPIEFQDLFNELLDDPKDLISMNNVVTPYETEDLKKRKLEVFDDESYQIDTPNADDFQFPNDFHFSLENNDLTLSSLVDIKTENTTLFPEEEEIEEIETPKEKVDLFECDRDQQQQQENIDSIQEEEDEEEIEFTQSLENRIVPFHQYDQSSKNLIIPREHVQELTNGDPTQDLLIKSLMVAHLKQEQELRELRDLVSNLQNLLIVQATMKSPPSSNGPFNVQQHQ